EYKTVLGDFSSAKGELRLLNVTAGVGGRSYMNYSKVPTKLTEFCSQLNADRKKAENKSITELYKLSFDAHFNLVTIHPWADGNGRMARLVMNMLQFEFGLIPTKILKEDKEEYIKALVTTREDDDLDIFRGFMTSQ
ncbi:MAG: Fic family protein, partial [Alistipes sp.]|nr:Fic family protein [Alistipes sp.]